MKEQKSKYHNIICRISIISLLFFCALPLHSQIKQIHKGDYRNLSKPERIEKLLEISNSFQNSNITSTMQYAIIANHLAKKYNDKSAQIKANLIIADYWKVKGIYSKAGEYYYTPLQIAEQSHNNSDIALCYLKLGEYLRATRKFEKSLDHLYYSLKLYSELNDSSNIAAVYNRMAASFYEMSLLDDNYDDSAGYYVKLSIDIAENISDSALLASNCNIYGAYFNKIKKPEKALEILLLSLDILEKTQNEIDQSNILNNIAFIYRDKKDYNQAIKYAEKSYEIAKKYDVKAYCHVAAHILTICNEKLGNYKDAFYYEVITQTYLHSLFSEDNIIKQEENKTRYEIEKKNIEIRAREKFVTIIIAIILFFVCILIVFIILLLKKGKLLRASNLILTNKNELISKQKNKLNELNSTKDKFFSIIAHDLRSPLGSFKNISEMLGDLYYEISEQEKLELINLMSSSSKNIYTLLENLLDWAHSQKGTLQFNPVLTDIKIIIDNTISLLSISADAKTIKLINKLTYPLFITIDPNLITTVVRNLLANAIKFTGNGGIIEISSKDEDEAITISFKDNGIGINEEIKDKLFRIDINPTTLGTSSEKGSGLGLILCKEFIERHNGKIWVESELGKGSTFSFLIPKKFEPIEVQNERLGQ